MPKVCKICLNNDLLCHACNSLLVSGKVSVIEIEVSRALHRLGIEAVFVKAVYSGNVYVLAGKKDARTLIGRNGRNSKRIEAEMKKKVRIIENGGEKGVIENVLGTDIIGVNILYSPEEKYRIRVQKIFRNRVKSAHIAALRELLRKDYEVVFE